jgi:hypothetical protein
MRTEVLSQHLLADSNLTLSSLKYVIIFVTTQNSHLLYFTEVIRAMKDWELKNKRFFMQMT